MKNLTNIKYIGVNDHKIDLFEGQYPVPNGMSYNSYAVIDEKIAIFDTVDVGFGSEWLSNLENALSGKTPDYLIVQHMEPDHSANIHNFAVKYPDAKIIQIERDNRHYDVDLSNGWELKYNKQFKLVDIEK